MNKVLSLSSLSLLALAVGIMAAPAYSVGWDGSVRAKIRGPIESVSGKTVKVTHATRYYCSSSGSVHTALDISRTDGSGCSNGSGGANVTAVFDRYKQDGVTKQKTKYEWEQRSNDACYGSAIDNRYVVNGENGWKFYIAHLQKHGNKGTIWANKGETIGKLGGTGNVSGPHVHVHNDKYGVRKSYWYTTSMTAKDKDATSCGTQAGSSKTIGYAKMQDNGDWN